MAKKDYFASSQDFTWDEHDKKVELLNEKHETEQKLQQNELLVSQSKLKQLELKEREQKNNKQQMNTLLIILVMVVFFLMFIRQLRVRNQLIRLAKTDSLTQLPNRRFLFEQGQKIINSLNKDVPKLTVVVVDVDYFKKVNDQHGHDVGDKVLQQLAMFGKDVMRNRDVFARLGGEEFVAVLPDASIDEAKAISERLREKFSECDYSDLGILAPLSLSIGISALNEQSHDFEELLHNADLAMYHAKTHGRDQVVIYDKSMNTINSSIRRSSH